LKPIIEIQNISKKYRLLHEIRPYLSLRENLFSVFTKNKNTNEDFLALQDITFNVEKGETIGIIGKNGAGKSTLLKILSKIIPPTEGKIIVRGRIASLLEVGTGFHLELSGRENIFLNGSILGMKKKEISGKFDEIVDFSGVEQFLDTPLKHYSSGMQLRLAFAVAAFLEPEILIIDEVLSVGDAEFQKKCMGKMNQVSKNEGRTVIFVSHNMNAVASLCSKAIYLKKGKIFKNGETNNVINDYLNNETILCSAINYATNDELSIPGDEFISLLSVRLINSKEQPIDYAYIHEKIGIECIFKLKKDNLPPIIPNIHVFTSKGEYAFVSSVKEKESSRFNKMGTYKFTMWINENLLNQETYVIGVAATSLSPVKVHFFEKESIRIEMIEDINLRDNSFKQQISGVMRPKLDWSIININ